MLHRRQILALLACGISHPAFALGVHSRFDVGELMLPAGTLSRPRAWNYALNQLIQSTSIETNGEETQCS